MKGIGVPQGGETSELAVFDLDEAGGGDAGAMQEGGVLEGSGLLYADVEVEGCIWGGTV